MRFQGSRLIVILGFAVVALGIGALFSFPAHAQEPDVKVLQEKVKILEKKLEGYEEIKKELNAVKDLLKNVQKEQAEQKSKIAKQEKEVEPLKKAAEGLSKVNISGGSTGILQGTNNIPSSEGGDDGFASGSFDIVFEYEPVNNWKVVLDLEGVGGDGPDNFTSLHGVNGDAGTTDDTVTILEAYLEGTLFDERVIVTVGKIDITGYIDGNAYAGDETTQFLSGSFVNNAVFSAPDNAPGVRTHVEIIPGKVYVEGGVMAQDENGDGRTTDKLFEDVFAAVEVGVMPNLFGRPGTYRIWGSFDGAGQKRHSDGSLKDETALGIGLSADQEVTDWLGLFFRIGARDSDNVNYTTKAAWSAGAQFMKIIPMRPDDVIGVAYGEIMPTKRDFGRNAKDEKMVEAYYSWFINENFQISAIFQHIMNRNASPTLDDVTLLGLRGQANF